MFKLFKFAIAAFFSICALALTLSLSGCTSQENIDGKYLGKDTSKSPGTPIEVNLARAGDGYVNGTLAVAEGPVKTALIVGTFGYFTNEIKFVVNEGPCAGTYAGTFTRKDNMISGHVDEAAKCPDFMRFFEFQKQ